MRMLLLSTASYFPSFLFIDIWGTFASPKPNGQQFCNISVLACSLWTSLHVCIVSNVPCGCKEKQRLPKLPHTEVKKILLIAGAFICMNFWKACIRNLRINGQDVAYHYTAKVLGDLTRFTNSLRCTPMHILRLREEVCWKDCLFISEGQENHLLK